MKLQTALMINPEIGSLIRGGGGIRKARVSASGRGKRGGARMVYYWVKSRHQIYMLTAYAKAKADSLSDHEVASLRDLVKGL